MLEQVKKNAGYKAQNALKGVKFFSEPLFSRRKVKPETFSLSENGRLEAKVKKPSLNTQSDSIRAKLFV